MQKEYIQFFLNGCLKWLRLPNKKLKNLKMLFAKQSPRQFIILGGVFICVSIKRKKNESSKPVNRKTPPIHFKAKMFQI
jgi:hypothetical protein